MREKGAGNLTMENLLGLLRIHVIRGINLAVRDVRSSDPYVKVRMGKQVRERERESLCVFCFPSFYVTTLLYMCVWFFFASSSSYQF